MDELATTSDDAVECSDELGPLLDRQAVGVGDQTKAGRPIGGEPAQTVRVDLILEGNAHAGELGEIVHRATWSAIVEVEQTDCDAVVEHDVLKPNIVVTHVHATLRVGHVNAPDEPS